MAYTYDDFVREANNSGLYGNFSQYDLDLAQKHPDAGLSILSSKRDYQNATTEEQRLLANEMANQIRSSYGNYTGGSDGSQYYSTGMYANQIDDQLGKIGNYGSFSYDSYSDPYQAYQQQLLDSLVNRQAYNNQYAVTQQQLIDAIINREDFSYNKEDDPQWGSYKKSYLREGDRVTANALAQTSAASGGRASSYAVNAATQAGDYYATKLNDVIPQLYNQAYDRYLNEYQMKLSDLGAVNTQEQMDYGKYLDDYNMNLSSLGAVNTQQNMDYGRYQDARDFSYKNYIDEYARENNYLSQLQGQDATDYSRFLDQVGIRTDESRYQDSYQQQLIDNAMKMYQIYGYVPDNLSEILGLPSGTPTADQAYNEWYMSQQAANAASRSSSGGNNNSKNNTEDDKKTDDSYGIDMNSVLALGYGPISIADLEVLEQRGEIVSREVNGKIVFTRVRPLTGSTLTGTTGSSSGGGASPKYSTNAM